jgi:PAS domain-containing protein
MDSRSTETLAYEALLVSSYKIVTGRELCDNIASNIYEIESPIVSHGTQSDPIFCYANLAAQKLFEYSWDEFVSIPSRLSAEPDEREERQYLLERAMRDGYVDDYSGVRISKSGQRFRIFDTTLWQVIDELGNLYGQAAIIRGWEYMAC